MSVKISELPLLSDLADNDVLAGVDTSANATKKIELATLKNYIDTNTTYTAGTNIDITNNVVSAPNVYNKTEVDEQIEELQSEVESLSTIYNAFPTTSGEGESLTLEDTAETKFKKIDLKGSTSQNGTPTPDTPIPVNVVSGDNSISICGKNLFDKTIEPVVVSNGVVKSVLETGIRIQYTGSTTITGSYDYGIFIVKNLTNYIGKTIRVKANFTTSSSNTGIVAVGLCNEDGSNRSNKGGIQNSGDTFSLVIPTLSGEQKYLYISLYANANGTRTPNCYVDYTNLIITIDNEDMTYEPYTGATYPINLPVENLFDKTKTPIYNIRTTLTQVENGLNVSRTGTTGGFVLIPVGNIADYVGKKLTFSYDTNYKNEFRASALVNCDASGGNRTTIQEMGDTNLSFTITLASSYSQPILAVRIYLESSAIAGTEYLIENIQLEVSDKQNSYTPYGTTPIELCKIGDYQDYFLHDKTLDKWYLHKEIGKIDMSTLSWDIQTNYYRASSFNVSASTMDSYSNIGKVISLSALGVNTDNRYAFALQRMWWRLSQFETLEDFKTYINANHPYVLYRISSYAITDTEITYQPLIDQLNNLEKAMSYNGQTNISQVNNDLPFIISAEAIMSLQNVLDRIELLEG